jgi:hypothetical protein
MITKEKEKASFSNELQTYITFGVLPSNATLEMVQSINLSLLKHNETNANDQLELIDTRLYQDYGYLFASDCDAEKFRKYIKEYSIYSFMNLAGKPVVVNSFYENNIFKYEFSSINDFKSFHRQDKFDVLNGKRVETVYFADLWLESSDMRTRYTRTVFDPSNKQDKEAFNFWKGYIKPIKGDVQPFIDHINKLIKGTQAEKDYIIKMLAYSVRFPDRLTGVALAFRGNQGAGKSTISETMKAICPNHTKSFDSMDVLFDFNAETVHTKYFLMEESVWGGEISKQGKLKNLITCNQRAIKVKNITGFDITNYGFFIFTSNESWMLPIEKGDRRFSIFDTTNDLIDNFEYFNNYYKWLETGGANALLHYFLNEIKLDDFNPKTVIANSAKTDIKAIGLPAVEKYIYGLLSGDYIIECLESKDETIKDSWDNTGTKIDRNVLFEHFSNTIKREKIEQIAFSRKLAEILSFPEKWKDNWKYNGKIFYKLPSKIECMVLLSKYLKETPEQLFPSYDDLRSKI